MTDCDPNKIRQSPKLNKTENYNIRKMPNRNITEIETTEIYLMEIYLTEIYLMERDKGKYADTNA